MSGKSRSAFPRDALELNLVQLTSQETPLLKFGRGGKPGFRNFQLSADLSALNWTSKNKKATETRVLIRDIKEIRYGQRTDKFKRNNRPDLDALSFSIIYLDHQQEVDTLDLVCKDEVEFQMWTTTLAALVEGKIDVQSFLHSTGAASSSAGGSTTGATLWNQSPAGQYASINSSMKMGMYDSGSINVPPPRKKSIKPKISRAARDAFKEANDVYVFGSNVWGEAGYATKEKEITQPKLLETMLGKHVVQIACGWSHTVVVIEDGTMVTYGNRIGTGKEEDWFTPVPAALPVKEKVEWAACGAFHSAAVTEKGNLFTWGCNFNGQLGHGNRLDYSSPRMVEALAQTQSFALLAACGANFTAVLNDEGMLYTMGANEHGQLGLNHQEDVLVPNLVHDLQGTEITKISCGHAHMVALSGNGFECYAWGLNSCGQLGLGHEDTVYRPHMIESLRGQHVKDVDCGACHTFAIVHQNKLRIDLLYAWGSNMKGQCGHSKKVKVLKPVVVDVTMSHENPFVEVKCGSFHTIVRQQDGSVLTTGSSMCGQLGHGNTTDESSLRHIDFLHGKGARAVIAGGNQSCVLTSRAWVEDSEAKTCMACQTSFTLLLRKHHCRNCGGIFCQNCSSKKIAVLKFHLTEPVRVCNNCYTMLGGR